MFTGIIEALGKVGNAGPRRLKILTDLSVDLGESIAVNGVCLTAAVADSAGFSADLSEETLARTTLSLLSPDDPVNLERPVVAGGRLGGHVVQGHVDAVGKIAGITENPGSTTMWITYPEPVRRYLAVKGSVAVEGISLTVSGLNEDGFSVDLIPITLRSTTLGRKQAGELVNLEADVLAKYVEAALRATGR